MTSPEWRVLQVRGGGGVRRTMAVMVALSVALLAITVALGMLVRAAAFALVAVQ